jgi:hypothetical protein
MPPDGISTEDWDEVYWHTVAVVNAETDEASHAAKRVILACLDRLEARYGELPSILATRADYVEDEQHQRLLLERAYDLATARGDGFTGLWTALDLVKLHLDGRALADAERWLAKAREHLNPDNSSPCSYAELVSALARVQRGESPATHPLPPLAEDALERQRKAREAEERWLNIVFTTYFVFALNTLEHLTTSRMLRFLGALTISLGGYALTPKPKMGFVFALAVSLALAGGWAYLDVITSGLTAFCARYVSW